MELDSTAAGGGETGYQSLQHEVNLAKLDAVTTAAGETGVASAHKDFVQINGENIASESSADDVENSAGLDVLSSGVSSGVDESDVTDSSTAVLMHTAENIISASTVDEDGFDEVDKGMPSSWLSDDAARTSKTKLSKRECLKAYDTSVSLWYR
jgi:hypothetical protein